MAWSWSHTSEAYRDAREQLEAMERDTRNVIAAEWLAADGDNLDERKYARSLPRVASWNDERINEFIWEAMERQAMCTNGGWEAHCCPFGCGCHMVPFEPVAV